MSVRRSFLCVLLAGLTAVGCSRWRGEPNPYAGTWVLRYHGRNLLSFSFESSDHGLRGTWTRPRLFNYDQDGDFTRITSEHTVAPLTDIVHGGSVLRFAAGAGPEADRFIMRVLDASHAEVRYQSEAPPPPWRLERAATPDEAVLAVHWADPPASPDVVAVRDELKRMAAEDQGARRLARPMSPTDISRMAAVDASHQAEVLGIFGKYGWPQISVFGKEAAQDFWLLVQHQPLEVQARMLPAMERAADAGEASRSSYAMLYDRVMAGEGRPQRWGLQASCIGGKAVLAPVEDAAHLEERRRALYFPPVAVYLRELSAGCPAAK